jgi:hypothetical protein
MTLNPAETHIHGGTCRVGQVFDVSNGADGEYVVSWSGMTSFAFAPERLRHFVAGFGFRSSVARSLDSLALGDAIVVARGPTRIVVTRRHGSTATVRQIFALLNDEL